MDTLFNYFIDNNYICFAFILAAAYGGFYLGRSITKPSDRAKNTTPFESEDVECPLDSKHYYFYYKRPFYSYKYKIISHTCADFKGGICARTGKTCADIARYNKAFFSYKTAD